MNELAYELAAEMRQIAVQRFAGSFSDIKEVRLFWHDLFFFLVSKIDCLLLSRKKRCTPDDLCALEILPRSVLQFARDNAELLGDWPDRKARKLERSFEDLSVLRECFLGIELCVTEIDISIRQGKTARSTIGSYYTPYALARSVVEKVFSKPQTVKLLQKKKDTVRIADLSCGGGEFLLAAQEQLLENYGISYEISSRYFWGIDIDPIALQITVCRLLDRSVPETWDEIASHFMLGNPLLDCSQEGSLEEKNQLFAYSQVYALQMGFDFSKWGGDRRFDIILGNPPWEKIRFEERKFFSSYAPEIASIAKKNERETAIASLEDKWTKLYCWAADVAADYAMMTSARFRHPFISKAASGELNTYSLFSELAYNLLSDGGVCSLVVKSTLVTAPAHRKWWSELLQKKAVESVYLFDNRNRLFSIDSRERFAVLTVMHSKNERFSVSAGLGTAEDLLHCKEVALSAQDALVINPFTQMLPNISCTDDLDILLRIHRRLPPFGKVYPHCHFGRLIHLTAHAGQIDMQKSADNVPIYEGKFIEQYDARYSTFAGVRDGQKYSAKASAAKNAEINGQKPLPESRYFVHEAFWKGYLSNYNRSYSLCWRSLTSPTNARTMIAMILPTCPTCQSIQMLQTEDDVELVMLLGLFDSLPFDYFVRLKMPGIDLTQSVIRQIPVPDKNAYDRIAVYNGIRAPLKGHILSHIRLLLQDEDTLQGLLRCLDGLTYEVAGMSREDARKTLDRLFADAYELDEDMYYWIKQSFPKYE